MRTRHATFGFAITLGVFAAAGAAAQTPAAIVPIATHDVGQEVRVTEANGATVSGRLHEVDGNALLVAPSLGRIDSIDARNVARFEVREPLGSAERSRRGWWGLTAGALIGAGAGYLVAIPRVRAAERRHTAPFEQIDYLVDPVVGAIGGAAIGVAIGRYPVHAWVVRYP